MKPKRKIRSLRNKPPHWNERRRAETSAPDMEPPPSVELSTPITEKCEAAIQEWLKNS